MPKNDIEVFEFLISDAETSYEIDYLAYAMFAYKKSQWIDHCKSLNNGVPPTQAEIDNWVSQLSPYEFRQLRSDAAEFFHIAAEEHLSGYIEERIREGINKSILNQVRSFTNWWKHLALALGMAVLAPVLLGGIIYLIGVFDASFPIHINIATTASEMKR